MHAADRGGKGRPQVTAIQSRSRDEQTESAQLGLFGEGSERVEEARPGGASKPERSIDDVARSALDHLNEVTERTGPAKFTSPTSIKARIQDGASLEDLLVVIDFCHAMWWGDAKMETFIRPKTLFGKENFPEYLVRARKWHADGRPPLLGGAAKGGAGDRRLDMYSVHVKGGRADSGRADRS
jgi:uncharacterized phage protein (TIGR02220 family)